MYNKQFKAWESEPCEESILIWCREPFNRENPQALFKLADHALGQASTGKDTAEAVYWMEKAALLGLPEAALAMGQMFQYGWAVHRSLKTAQEWYVRAAALGSAEAAACLEALRRRKKRHFGIAGAVVTCLILAVVCVAVWIGLHPKGIRVHEDTHLIESTTLSEFQAALQDVIGRNDDELVVSGQRSTNRILLMFQGEGIDLSAFPAAEVIVGQDNYLVIQFETEEEAQRCLEALQTMSGIVFVNMDTYYPVGNVSTSSTGVQAGTYHSAYSGKSYYTWGAEFLGLDRLAEWLMNQNTTPVTVAVLDTGVDPCPETQSRILPGIDVTGLNQDGCVDTDGHGTHVSGTILDCTQGLDVTILPVCVFPGTYTSDSYVSLGLQYAIQNDVDIINMSLGGPYQDKNADGICDGVNDYFIREAYSKGIVVVVSAGNGDEQGNPIDTKGQCPAHIDECIVVAACDANGDLGYFSNYGDSVDVCAPGVDITSYYTGDTLDTLSGTSMAAPHISALAAMLRLYMPDRTPKQIESYIYDYCIDMGDPLYYGEGIPWAAYFAGY